MKKTVGASIPSIYFHDFFQHCFHGTLHGILVNEPMEVVGASTPPPYSYVQAPMYFNHVILYFFHGSLHVLHESLHQFRGPLHVSKRRQWKPRVLPRKIIQCFHGSCYWNGGSTRSGIFLGSTWQEWKLPLVPWSFFYYLP